MDYHHTLNKFTTMNRFLLFFMSCSCLLFSQEYRSIEWTGFEINDQGDSLLTFNNSLYDQSRSLNNIYFEKIPIQSQNVKLNFFDVQCINVDDQDIPYVNDESFLNNISFDYHVGSQKNQNYIFLYFSPFIIHNNILKKIVSFKFLVEEVSAINRHKKSAIQNSVLSNGTWYKIGVTQSGIHEIDMDFLNAAGIDLSSINPKNLRLYGNKSGVLNEGFYEIDDLQEMSIEVIGEEDEIFDNSDKILFFGQAQKVWYQQGDSYDFKNNIYSDTTFYFLNFDLGPGKRIALSQLEDLPTYVDNNVSTYDAYFAYEQDLTNLVNTGRQWMGEAFAFNQYQVFNHTSQHIELTEPSSRP